MDTEISIKLKALVTKQMQWMIECKIWNIRKINATLLWNRCVGQVKEKKNVEHAAQVT